MKRQVYDIEVSVEQEHWWFKGRRKLLQIILSEMFANRKDLEIYDLGCGTGSNVQLLKKYGKVAGVDCNKTALSFSIDRGFDKVIEADICQMSCIKSKCADLVVITDVLEHLDDDLKALQEINRISKDDGRVIITVPAFSFLSTTQDDFYHHKRRYTQKEISQKMSTAKFNIERLTYFNLILSLPILLIRSLMKLLNIKVASENKINNRFLNFICQKIFCYEVSILEHTNLPFGVSILVVAKKSVFQKHSGTKVLKSDFLKWNEAMAKKYDPELFFNHPNIVIRYIENKRIKNIISYLKPSKDDIILDVGCGTGKIDENINVGKIVGIDISDFLLRKSNLKEKLKAKAEETPFKDYSLSKIICSEVLEHTIEPEVVLVEMRRILKDKGKLVVSIPNERNINFVKKIYFNFFHRDRKNTVTNGYRITQKMDDEWHLHSFNLTMFKRIALDKFIIKKVKYLPFRLFPLRYVIVCKPL